MAKILTVDDEADVQFLLKVTLEMAGHEVEQAPHGEAALALLDRVKPDVVITDLMMPVMDGKELIERVRAIPELAGVPILLLSAAPITTCEADLIMRKPFVQAELISTVEQLVQGVA